MILLTIALLVSTFALISIEWIYFKRQKEKCNKYPFFKLRDEIIQAIATSEHYKKFQKMYDIVNWTIERLKQFDYNFFSSVTEKAFSRILEKAYENNYRIDEQFIKEIRESKFAPFEGEYIMLIIQAAKKNSFLFRIAMTNLGFRIFFKTKFAKALVRFSRRHPSVRLKDMYLRDTKEAKKQSTCIEKKYSQIETIRDYSVLNYVLARV